MPAEAERVDQQDTVVSSEAVASHKKKQVLVCLLLIGLLVAVLTQPESQDADRGQVVGSTLVDQTDPSTKTSSETEAPETPAMRADRLSRIRELSRIELPEITNIELLAAEPQRVHQTQFSSAQRVQAIYGTSTDRAALIGHSIVRSGQPLSDGQKVLSVTADGIQLAR